MRQETRWVNKVPGLFRLPGGTFYRSDSSSEGYTILESYCGSQAPNSCERTRRNFCTDRSYCPARAMDEKLIRARSASIRKKSTGPVGRVKVNRRLREFLLNV